MCTILNFQGRPPSSPLQLACSFLALSTSTILVLSQVRKHIPGKLSQVQKNILEHYLRSKNRVPGKFYHPAIFQVGLDFSDSAYFWLVVAVITSGAYCLHCRFPTNVYTRLRMYLELIGSLLTLLNAGGGLEEPPLSYKCGS